jgi:hypothetical protein
MLTKEIKKELDVPYSWIGRANIVKMSVFPKLICRLNVIAIKIPANYSANFDKMILKTKDPESTQN